MSKIERNQIKIRVLNQVEPSEHFHPNPELIYVLDGSLEICCDQKIITLNKSDLFFVNANHPHSLKSNGTLLYASFQISYELISNVITSSDLLFWCAPSQSDSISYQKLRDTADRLLLHYMETNGSQQDFRHIRLGYELLELLNSDFVIESSLLPSDSSKEEHRIAQISNYLQANYSREIRLEDLATALYLSPGYLSRYFKKVFGKPFIEYLTDIRLYHAMDDLLYTDHPITRIAADNGFASPSVFNRYFKKKYGETPSTRRKALSSQPASPVSDTQDLQKLEAYFRKDSIPAVSDVTTVNELQVSLDHPQKFNNIWSACINIGSAEELLRSDVQEHVLYLKEKLHFRYIRFWNIFSGIPWGDSESGENHYNFSRLNSILDFLIGHQLIPWIELGQKPKRISRTTTSNTILSSSANNYYDHARQANDVLKAFMKNLVNRYGYKEIDRWIMELWYDESYKPGVENYKTYFSLFEQFYNTIREFSPRMKFGGCGYNTLMFSDTENQFLEMWAAEKVHPDFITCTEYPYEFISMNGAIYSRRSTDSDYLLHEIRKVREQLTAVGFDDLPLWITEFNLSISDRNFINDSCWRGAYLMHTILSIYGLIDGICLFGGTDRSSDYHDAGTFLFGGTGLLNREGILKPAGVAIDFLNRLYGDIVCLEQNLILAYDRRGTLTIVCTHPSIPSSLYYLTPEDELTCSDLWKYFAGNQSNHLKISIRGLEDGFYKLKRYRTNANNGNLLKMWAEMDYDDDLSQNDVRYLKNCCQPALTISKVETKDSLLNLDFSLEPNEISCIRIRKILL